MATESLNTGDGFNKYFEILPALTDSEKQATFRIRHSVYGEDLGWAAVRADGMETDAYDPQSLHCLVRSRASGDFIGCVRLVLAAPGNPLAPLPFERTCGTLTTARSSILPHSFEQIASFMWCRAISAPPRRNERWVSQDSDFGGVPSGFLSAGRLSWACLRSRTGMSGLFLLSSRDWRGISTRSDHERANRWGSRTPRPACARGDGCRHVIDHFGSLRTVFVVVRDELEAAYRTAGDKVGSGVPPVGERISVPTVLDHGGRKPCVCRRQMDRIGMGQFRTRR
jgi:hypothetical protein